MWKLFENLTLKGFTLSRIRQTFKDMNDITLDKYSDIPLLQRMIRICRANLPKGGN